VETHSRAQFGFSRRAVLRLFTALPLLAAGAAACSSGDQSPDPLLSLAKSAKADAKLARAVGKAYPGLAGTAEEIANAREQHAEALQREIERVNPPDPDAGPSVPEPPDQQAPRSASAAADALREALRASQGTAAKLVAELPPYRAGLTGSISASCACLLEVLGE
jgi:hypothetical protein